MSLVKNFTLTGSRAPEMRLITKKKTTFKGYFSNRSTDFNIERRRLIQIRGYQPVGVFSKPISALQ